MSIRAFIIALLLSGYIFPGCASDEIVSNTYCDNEYEKYREIFSKKRGAMSVEFYEDINARLKKVILNCENHVGLLLLVASSSLPLQKNMEGLSLASKALHIEPNNAEAMHVKGVILSVMGDKIGSLELLVGSVKSDPTNVVYKLNYCSTLELFGEYKTAIDVCTDIIDNYKADPIVYFIRSRAYKAIGDSQRADQDIQMYHNLKDKIKR